MTSGRPPTGLSPSAVIVMDVNGDGKLDLVTTSAGSDTVSLLLGNGMARTELM